MFNLRKIQLALLTVIAISSSIAPVVAQPKPTPTATPSTPSTATPKTPARWENFRSTTGRFSVDFPGKPKVESKENKYYFFSASDNEKFCLLTYADAETTKEAQDFLSKSARSIVEANGLTITKSKDISIKNNSGKEFTIKTTDSNTIAGTARAYLVGKRRYVMFEVYKNPRDQASKRFVDSFKLI
jgi:hypothetical protein